MMYFTASGTRKIDIIMPKMFISKICHSVVRLSYIKTGMYVGQHTHVAEALTISVGVMLTGGGTIWGGVFGGVLYVEDDFWSKLILALTMISKVLITAATSCKLSPVISNKCCKIWTRHTIKVKLALCIMIQGIGRSIFYFSGMFSSKVTAIFAPK